MTLIRISCFLVLSILVSSCREQLFDDTVSESVDEANLVLVDIPAVSDSIANAINCLDSTVKCTFLYEDELCALYGEIGFSPIWSNELGLKPSIDSFLQDFQAGLLGREHAFNFEHLLPQIDSLRLLRDNGIANPNSLVFQTDLALSDWLAWVIDKQATGIVTPDIQNSIGWHINDSLGTDVLAGLRFLREASGAIDMSFLEGLLGDFPVGNGMQEAYKFWSAKESDSIIPELVSLKEGEKIELGYSGPELGAIQERLFWKGFGQDSILNEKESYDSVLYEQVKDFQIYHGLYPDGVIGQGTVASLNLNPKDYIDILRVNQERRRWLLPESGDFFIYVNIPEFYLRLYRNDSLLFGSKVVVGKKSRQTPVFTAPMTYIEINPTWTIPPTILSQDVLPQLSENTDYLKNKNIGVYTSEGKWVNPDSVNWSSYSAKSLPYKLRQAPGWSNSLGVIKFMFPNKYYVYIHDTPDKSYFSFGNRARSSGCIRIADPRDFADWLLQGDTAWTQEKLVAKLGGKNQKISLEKQPTVYLLYLTAAMAGEDGFRFYQDVYGKDAFVLGKLDSSLSYQQALMILQNQPSSIGDYSSTAVNQATSGASHSPETN
jgi:murein L,D-transpeptidase YcbB/YkuD